VLDDNRRPLGYIDVVALKSRWEAGGADPVCGLVSSRHSPTLTRALQNDRVFQYMTKFKRSAEKNPYTLMTPETELADLERFLDHNLFALGLSLLCSSYHRLTREQ
jgi:hypothetical protein